MGRTESSRSQDDSHFSPEESLPESVARGRKSVTTELHQPKSSDDNAEDESVATEPELDEISDDDDDDDDSSYYDSDSDDEDDEEWNERLRILEDARKLKQLAKFFLHPEKAVEEIPEAKARCYFDRPSAPERLFVEEADERNRVMEDMKAIKKLAADYMHPERPVVTSDSSACARNFYTRPSAPKYETEEEADERDRILAETQQLKKLAVDYMHPEKPVVTSDSAAFGRNFFSRPSAAEQEDDEDAEDRVEILEDMKQLKKLAVDYMHPERPVVAEDPALFGRNYYSRASAPEMEDVEEAQERARILEETKQLKRVAVDYMHPENPVVTSDPAACGHNFFTRPSATEYEEDAAERVRILEETMQLKKLAVDYMHPERPVAAEDPTTFGRNYFSRPSAIEQEDDEDAEERAEILEEMKQLKKLAVDFMHPERPVVAEDPALFGRNYFSRPSAPEMEDAEAEERARILAETQQLKKLAVDYMHPENPVVTSDPTACGRNFFTRPSATEYEDEEDSAERARVLEETKQLKKLAVDYMHPEKPVVTSDPAAFGRNYFSRPSAIEQEDDEDAEERAEILDDMKQLKKLAVDYLHPERPVVAEDPALFGRNYYSRASAPEVEDVDEAEERARILEETKQLKKVAVDYMHSELPVVTSDATACGRNFFTRASAPEYETEEDAEERERILDETKQLKKLATDHMHPENPVVTSDPAACGRNYFSRPSAPEMEDAEEAEERARVLEETKQLKKVAVDYMHPENPVVTSDPTACGHNYFSRPSAPEQEDDTEVEERARVLDETKQLKKLAVDYLHPEVGVKTTDPFASGRNYFNRPSAEGHGRMIHSVVPHDDHEEDPHHLGMDDDMELFADMRQNIPSGPADDVKRPTKSEGGNNSSSLIPHTGEPIFD